MSLKAAAAALRQKWRQRRQNKRRSSLDEDASYTDVVVVLPSRSCPGVDQVKSVNGGGLGGEAAAAAGVTRYYTMGIRSIKSVPN